MSINDEESRLMFIDHVHGELGVGRQLAAYSPDAVLVVLGLEDRASRDQAEVILQYLAARGVIQAGHLQTAMAGRLS